MILSSIFHVQANVKLSAGLRDAKRELRGVLRALALPGKQCERSRLDAALFDLAAPLTFGLIKNHPFVDGNKRVAFTAAVTFLHLDNRHVHATEVDATVRTLALAAGDMTEAEYAAWWKANSRRAQM